MTKQELIKALERSHGALLSSLGDLDDKQMVSMHIVDDWTPKDLLSHISRWENVCAGYLERIAADEPIPLLDLPTNEWNARALQEDRGLSLDQVWRNSDFSFMRVKVQVETLGDGALDRSMRGPWHENSEALPLHKIIAIDTSEHYQTHLRNIEEQRQSRKSESSG